MNKHNRSVRSNANQSPTRRCTGSPINQAPGDLYVRSMKRDITIKFFDEVAEFAASHLPVIPEAETLVHTGILDPYVGAIDLYAHEIDLLNSPLLQRLRQIHQMAFAFFAYPTARHSRFEHSIGAVRQSAAMAAKLRSRQPGMLDDITIREIRLAALLHDCGHGCFSHSSETYYGNFAEIDAVRRKREDMLFAAPHEIMSCLIIESEPFAKLLRGLQKKYRIDIDPKEITDCILGVSRTLRQFKSEVINGPFDADNLDYVLRDSSSLGIGGPSLAEVELLMSDIDVTWIKDQPCMTISSERLSVIEHLLFSKMLMFSAVYSQAALRACECMLHGVFEYCRRHDVKLDGRAFKTPLDFLWATDYQLMTAGQRVKEPVLARLLQNLVMRRFLIPSIVISNYSVREREALFKFREILRSFDARRELSQEILEEAHVPCVVEEVWVDVPGIPSLHSFESIPVTMGDESVTQLGMIIPISAWATTFLEHKWRAFVFCPPEHRERIAKAASSVIDKMFDLKLNRAAFLSG